MISIIGIAYFELRTFTFKELNIPPVDESKKYSIEVVETYFHLFSIPIFSLGKRIKLGFHGDLLELSPELKQRIDRKIANAPGKWYSFAGIYMIVIALVLFFIDQKVEENRLQKIAEKKKQEQLSYLEKPKVGDLCFFISNGEDQRAEVHQVSRDSVLITLQKKIQPQKSKRKSSSSRSNEEFMEEFIQQQERLNFLNDSLHGFYPHENLLCSILAQKIIGENVFFVQFWISKFDLKKSFCPENNCRGVLIKNSADEFHYPIRLREVDRQIQSLNGNL